MRNDDLDLLREQYFSDTDPGFSHYGTPRHSGRYPWGSGENPYQRSSLFMRAFRDLKKAGMSEVEIAKGWNMTTSELRERRTRASNVVRNTEARRAMRLHDKGYTNTAIGRMMGKSESSIRSLLDPAIMERKTISEVNASILRKAVEKNNYIDVGSGTNLLMGISAGRLSDALKILKDEGYAVHNVSVRQVGTGKDTTFRVLAKPGTTWAEIFNNRDKIKLVDGGYSEDGGETSRSFEPPRSVDSKRIMVRYGDEGGSEKDGLIELRRGVDDISLKDARYAQVRIAVDGTHYLKGMAVYSNDIPDGVDIVFNTNKSRTSDIHDAMKPMENDPANPFGATIRSDDKLLRAQRHYVDKDGKTQLSALNIVYEEGNWDKWSKSLASQFLSKQPPELAKRQLETTYKAAKQEFDEIMALTNPTVRASILNKFADQCDADAVDLHAAALPRQATKALLPVPEIKDREIYAPGYRDGETVALVRYPHGGIFEIPVLKVNNQNTKAKEVVGDAIDAVGVNSKTAVQLSGADFDGDNVLVLPIDNVRIKAQAYLKDLQEFRPREQYKGYEGMKPMTDHEKGLKMGDVTNLITDMTARGAGIDEICRAVKHSMVVIDAKKHSLDWRQSAIDNGIAALKEQYQGSSRAGASTLLSRSTAEEHILERRLKRVSNMTPDELARYKAGEMIYENTGRMVSKRKVSPDGTVTWVKTPAMEVVPRMSLVDDAYDLIPGGRSKALTIEHVYAEYANQMKALATQARKEARAQEDVPYDPGSRKAYEDEYKSLKAKLELAQKNAPYERQAQLVANHKIAIRLKEHPGYDSEHIKRLKGEELESARKLVGAKKQLISISDREWEAINAGAITKSFLKEVLDNSDPIQVRKLATPKSPTGLSAAKIARAKSMLNGGKYTQSDVADILGVSISTLKRAIYGGA